ncbi:type 1 glutamine amidotransferase [Parapedobacter koreensis]|uniref:GMP synthase-Glutamine amidotransferase n=1 Tax=Parapedobacter koreensis TaxID=332977 RepID=A0A1H7M208_9SPHI|nr:type 1 glutamine amidotransferase [Parapedobacter koreensis]SEL05018.1 GMP synthase-Glutamine amidotransferase [Parapedobacter koreensis]
MNIHYFQHVPFEGPGYIQVWAAENGHSLTATRFFDSQYMLPELPSFDVLVVLGGPMSVFDEERYGWLVDEKRFIRKAIDEGKKILGVCLGAQLLATVLEAAVKPAPNKEIGWFPVSPTEEAKKLPWFYELFADHPMVFHWHGDKFEIPYRAINLASSDANKNQAFAVDDQLLGLQFHVETTPANVRDLVANAKAEIVPGNFIQDETELVSGIRHIADNRLCGQLLMHFFS